MFLEMAFIYIIVALLGLVIGSFLNVVIHRFAAGKSVVRPPSHCPHCSTFLKPADLVPVFSYLFLRGRCRYCKVKIPFRYAGVELLTAGVYLLTFYHYELTPSLFKYLLIFSILIVICGIDLDKKIIPNPLVLYLAVWALLWQIFYPVVSWPAALLGLLAGGGVFLLIALVSRGGMGGGDIKLMAVLGFLAGWPGVAGIFLLAFCLGALVGVIMLALKKAGRKTALPFGPFIALGFLLYTFYGLNLWNWYLSLFF